MSRQNKTLQKNFYRTITLSIQGLTIISPCGAIQLLGRSHNWACGHLLVARSLQSSRAPHNLPRASATSTHPFVVWWGSQTTMFM